MWEQTVGEQTLTYLPFRRRQENEPGVSLVWVVVFLWFL